MLDYSALRFISSQSPYFEFIRGLRPETRLGTTGGDVELAVYGWGHLPIFTSGNRAWQLGDEIFARAYRRASRSGPSSRAATRAITPTSPTIAPASTSSAIRC